MSSRNRSSLQRQKDGRPMQAHTVLREHHRSRGHRTRPSKSDCNLQHEGTDELNVEDGIVHKRTTDVPRHG